MYACKGMPVGHASSDLYELVEARKCYTTTTARFGSFFVKYKHDGETALVDVLIGVPLYGWTCFLAAT